MRGSAGTLIALVLTLPLTTAAGGGGTAALVGGAAAVTVQPADGSTLVEPPTEVSVTIPREGVREAHLTVATAQGVPVTDGSAVTRGEVLVVAVRIAAEGTYQVAYHMIRADGQVLAGVTSFGVGVTPEGHAEGPSGGHEHSADPINLTLTGVAGAAVLAMLFILFRRPRVRESKE